MTTTVRSRIGWPLLAVAGRPAAALTPLAAAVAVALSLVAALSLLPAPFDGPVLLFAALMTAAGTAASAADPAHPVSVAVPVPLRRRFAARAGTVVALSGIGLALAHAVATLADAGTDGLFLVWCAATAVALSVGAAVRRSPGDVPADAAVVGVLVAGMIVLPRLPAAVLTVSYWNSTPERLAVALTASAVLLLWATRDPAS